MSNATHSMSHVSNPFFELQKTLTLAAASRLVEAGLDFARAKKFNVTIAVADCSGDLLQLARLPKAMPASVDIAQKKARSALLFRRDTSLLEMAVNGAGEKPGRAALLSAGECLMGGGVLIKVDGQVVGAVGVSGETPQNDQLVAEACRNVDLQTKSKL